MEIGTATLYIFNYCTFYVFVRIFVHNGTIYTYEKKTALNNRTIPVPYFEYLVQKIYEILQYLVFRTTLKDQNLSLNTSCFCQF